MLRRVADDPSKVISDAVELSETDRAQMANPERHEAIRKDIHEASDSINENDRLQFHTRILGRLAWAAAHPRLRQCSGMSPEACAKARLVLRPRLALWADDSVGPSDDFAGPAESVGIAVPSPGRAAAQAKDHSTELGERG